MKKLLLILAVVFLVQKTTYADEGKGKRFEENKGRVLENLNENLGFLNAFKGCFTSAGFREELKSCKMTNKKIIGMNHAARNARKAEKEKRRANRK